MMMHAARSMEQSTYDILAKRGNTDTPFFIGLYSWDVYVCITHHDSRKLTPQCRRVPYRIIPYVY